MRLGPLIVIVLAAGLVPQWGSPTQAQGASSDTPPNILFIVTDDQRAEGTLGPMPRTRHWFREQGIRFPNGFVTTPLCCPSRATILTGQYAHNHGVHTNLDATDLDQGDTVQRYLHDAGYRTGIAGKFLNGWPLESDPAHFDRWTIFKGGYKKKLYNVDGQLKKITQYSTTYVAGRAATYLSAFEARDDRPWMLYVAPAAPHLPAYPQAKYEETDVGSWNGNPAVKEADRSDKPPSVKESDVSLSMGRDLRKRQLRSLLSVDDLVDGLMRQLGRLEERSRTLAVFMSDNGFFWGEHGLLGKRYPYEQSIRVPFFLRWPQQLSPGTTDGRLVANVDLVPTILHATGVPPDPQTPLDGRSLLLPGARDQLFLEHTVEEGKDVPSWGAILGPDIQYVEYYGATGEVVFREYYDLVADPWQLENLLGDGDPANDPPASELDQLSEDVERGADCVGTEGPGACP
jgi:arylsulfatase A-like enzyme